MEPKLIEICFLIKSCIPAILALVLANISLLSGGGRSKQKWEWDSLRGPETRTENRDIPAEKRINIDQCQ